MSTIKTLGAVCVLIAALAAGWFFSPLVLRKVDIGDDYMILLEQQAKECEEGGGCVIFSRREFHRAVMIIMMGGRQPRS